MTMNRQFIAGLAVVLLAAFSAGGSLAQPAKPTGGVEYPIVFNGSAGLIELGLSLSIPDDKTKPAFANTCYKYGGEASTVYLLSISDPFLARWTKRGFTRESLCLALVSEARFDPETGKRLPTYIVRHEDRIKAEFKGRDPTKLTNREIDALTESGLMTAELPLAVPNCFKNGTPYFDCTWSYGMKSGRKLPQATVDLMRRFGKELDQFARDAIANGKDIGGLFSEDAAPFLPITGYWGQGPIYSGQPEALIPKSWATTSLIDFRWAVIAPAFPRGYGYALNATGELGPGISVQALRDGLDGRRLSSRISASKLRQLLDD